METYKFIWVGGDLPLWGQISVMSFVKQNQKVELFTYGNIGGIPDGVIVRKGEDILPREEIFVNVKDGAGSYSGFADRFRYAMLYKEGGCYVDTDVIMLKVAYLPEFAFAKEDETYINNAVLKIPAGHNVAQDMLNVCRELGLDFMWGDTGPKLLTKKLTDYNLLDKILPKEFAYAIGPGGARRFIIPNQNIDHELQNSCFVHWWHEVFRRAGINVNAMPPEGSWLHRKFTEILEA